MKRILSLVLACTLILGCAFALASCGAKPNSDPKAAADALKAAGYEVDYEIYEEAEDDGLVAEVEAMKMDADLSEIENAEDLKDVKVDVITIAYYETEEAAKKAHEELEANFDKLIEGSKEYYGDSFEAELGISGKVVWMGTQAAIKAAK